MREQWLRDVDGAGSFHPCLPGDPGAIEYIPAFRLSRAEDRINELEALVEFFTQGGKSMNVLKNELDLGEAD